MRVGPIARAALAAALLAACTVITGCAAPTVEGEPLSGDEIRRLIVGNTLIGPIGGQQYDFSYVPDGGVYGSVGTDTGSGHWDVSDDGVYCHQWSQLFDATRHCYRWRRATGGRYLMVNIDTFRQYDIPVWRIESGLQF